MRDEKNQFESHNKNKSIITRNTNSYCKLILFMPNTTINKMFYMY